MSDKMHLPPLESNPLHSTPGGTEIVNAEGYRFDPDSVTLADPRFNGYKVSRLLDDDLRTSADLYVTTAAGPSGQRRTLLVGRIYYHDEGPYDFQVTDPTGQSGTAGWITRKLPGSVGRFDWSVYAESADGGISLVGWTGSVAAGCDWLINGAHAAFGRHDSERVNRPGHQPFDPEAGQ